MPSDCNQTGDRCQDIPSTKCRPRPPSTSACLSTTARNGFAESVEYLLNQSFSDFELIIADNASTDDTESICRELASRDASRSLLSQRRQHRRVPELRSGIRALVGEVLQVGILQRRLPGRLPREMRRGARRPTGRRARLSEGHPDFRGAGRRGVRGRVRRQSQSGTGPPVRSDSGSISIASGSTT